MKSLQNLHWVLGLTHCDWSLCELLLNTLDSYCSWLSSMTVGNGSSFPYNSAFLKWVSGLPRTLWQFSLSSSSGMKVYDTCSLSRLIFLFVELFDSSSVKEKPTLFGLAILEELFLLALITGNGLGQAVDYELDLLKDPFFTIFPVPSSGVISWLLPTSL